MTPTGEAPKLSPEEQAAIKRIDELKANAEKVKGEISKLTDTEAKNLKIAEARQITAQLEQETQKLKEATAARVRQLAEAKEAELIKAAPKVTPTVAPATTTVAPTVTPAVAPAPTPAVTPPAAPATTEAPQSGTDKMFEKLFQSDKVIGWLTDHPALREIAEVFASLFGMKIDWAKKEGEKLAGDSQAALSKDELDKLTTLTKAPKLTEIIDKNDPKTEDSAWKHVGLWLGLGTKIGSVSDFYSIVSKGKSKLDLGADKGGVQDVPNFTSMAEVPSTGYKVGDVIVYKNKSGDRIPVVVIDATDKSTPVISFINHNGIKPVGKKFEEIKELQYAIKGSLSDPSVQEGLSGFSVQSIYRQATLADQQKWYAENHPAENKPAAPAAAPTNAPTVAPTTAPTVAGTPTAAPGATPAPTLATAPTQPATTPAGAPPATPTQPAGPKPAAAPQPPATNQPK